ncbi:MAG: hypothetical protein QXI64_10855 [Sulfolobales archaeon]
MISPLVTLSLLAAISARLRSSAGTFTDRSWVFFSKSIGSRLGKA